MSTRCNIIVEDKLDKFWLYHHCDGYPEGVGADLLKRVKDVFKYDGYRAEDFVNVLVKDANDSYEITGDEHGDIEYLYFVDFVRKSLRYKIVSRHWQEDGLGCSTYYSKDFYLIGG